MLKTVFQYFVTLYIVTVTSDLFNLSLMNKSIHLLKELIKSY